jgi:hypothetical protein
MEDYLYVCGDQSLCRKIMPFVENYMAQVHLLSPEMEMYRTPPGRELHIDVKTLIECGL